MQLEKTGNLKNQCFYGITILIRWYVIFWSQTFFQFLTLSFKCDASYFFLSKIIISQKAENLPKSSFSRSNRIHDVTFWIQTFFSDSHTFYMINCKFYTMEKTLFQKLRRREVPNSKSCLSRMHGKCQIRRFHGVTKIKSWFYEFKVFTILTRFNFLVTKFETFRRLWFKFWCTVNFWIKNLTPCTVLNSYSDALLHFFIIVMRFEQARNCKKQCFYGISFFIMWFVIFRKQTHVLNFFIQSLKRSKGFIWNPGAV